MDNESQAVAQEGVAALAYVGWVVSERVERAAPAVSVAGNRFQGNLLRHLAAVSGPVHVLSIRPAAAYPKEPMLLARGEGGVIRGSALRIHGLPFINVRGIKEMSMAVVIFVTLAKWLGRKNGSKIVLVYNVFTPMAWPALAAARLFGARVVAIVADLPHGAYGGRGMLQRLAKLEARLQEWSLQWFDGLVVLTKHISSDFAPGVPAEVVEGGCDSDAGEARLRERRKDLDGGMDEFIWMYSGAVNRLNGVDVLLKAFHSITDCRQRLWIFGAGECEGFAEAMAHVDDRVRYFGRRSHDEVLECQRQATVLINPRPTTSAVVRYTFPSKLIEYMLSGRPVVSTVLPGVPPDYYQYIISSPSDSVEVLASTMMDVARRDQGELDVMGKRARNFVLKEKSWAHQARRIHTFLRKLQ